jgi:predicted lipoprotein
MSSSQMSSTPIPSSETAGSQVPGRRTSPTRPSPRRFRLVVAALAAALAVLMLLNTKFLTPDEVARIAPKPFDPAQTAADLWSRAQGELPGQAAPLGEVVTAFQSDLKAAAQKYKAVQPNENAYVFPVKLTGTVTEATPNGAKLQVDGVPAETPVSMALGPGLNGAVVRDGEGFKFAQAPGQTDFQFVGDELKKLMGAEVAKLGDPAGLQGKKVEVVGVVGVNGTGTSVPRPKPVAVQPVSVAAP